MPNQTGGKFDFGPGGIAGIPKQRGGFLEWLVPPLAVAKLARQKAQQRRRRRQQLNRRHQARMRDLQQDPGYQSRKRQANRPPPFYNLNNALNQRRSQHGFANSQAPQTQTGGIVATREQQARWLREYKLQQRGGSWWPDWIAPRPKKIVHQTRAEDRWTKKYHSATSKKYKQKGGTGALGIIGGSEERSKKQMAWIKKNFT
jgi:hypothetical protein